jgi:AcrR family transcriptional regulator
MIRMPAAKAAKAYHHGDLRKALLEAAEAELTENGFDGFSLRACARRAGVSHAAPAHHFGNAEGLMAELAIDAFGRLSEVMRAEMALAEKGTRDYMVAMARGYLRFALRNVGLFQLMFRLQEANHSDERVREAGAVAFALAAEAVGAFHQVSDLGTDPEVAPKVVGLWGMAHGLADLAIANQFGPPDEALDNLEAVLELVVGT